MDTSINNRPNLTANQIQNIIAFMGRTPLKGEEAPAFMECIQALHKLANNIEEQEGKE